MRRVLIVLSLMVGAFATDSAASYRPVAAASPPTPAFLAVKPFRATDTRDGYKIDDSVSNPKGLQTPGSTLTIPIGGRGGVPKNASAVTINLTATGTKTPGFLRVYPCGAEPPSTSSLNLRPDVDVANTVFSKLNIDGQVCIFSQGETHVIVDITGYVPAKASPVPLDSTRVTDTRDGFKIDDSVSNPKGPRSSGSTLSIPIAGRGGVPKNASAVTLNLTATGTKTPGYLRVYPCGTTPPSTSSLNLQPDVDVANMVYSKLGTKGDICVFTNGTTDVIVDITGYVPATASSTPLDPTRVTDTRAGFKIDDKVSDPKGIRTPGSTLTIPIAGRGGVPKDATSVTLNLTATGTTSEGFLRVYPCGTTPPTASSLNLQPNVDVANTVFSKLGADGAICVFAEGTTHVVVDINGQVTSNKCNINGVEVPTPIPQAECDALGEFYRQSGGRKWANQTGWNTDADPCAWFGVFCEADHVVRLNFVFNKLASLPPVVGQFPYLTDLNVGSNRLKSLPREIGNLTELKGLELADNRLRSLPSEIGNLKKLRYLSVVSNPFKSFPTVIGELTGLEVLNAPNIGLWSFPKVLLSLPKLESLELSGNNVRSLPDGITGLTSLRYLGLSHNGLTTVPKPVLQMTQLTSLALGENRIKTIPREIGNLTNLTYLYLANNRLSGDVTEAFEPLRQAGRMKSMGLWGNRCLTASPAVAAWLDGFDDPASITPKWNSGCK